MINFIKLLKGQYTRFIAYLTLSLISGLSSFSLIALVNLIIGKLVCEEDNFDKPAYFFGLLSLILIVLSSNRLLASKVIISSQKLFWSKRLKIIHQILRSPYSKTTKIKNKIYSALTNDVVNITQASLIIVDFVTSVIIVVTCLLYLAYLSPQLLSISFLIIIIAIGVYQVITAQSTKEFQIAHNIEAQFLKAFSSILDGIKEIVVDSSIGAEIYREKIKKYSEDASEKTVKAYVGFLNGQLSGQVIFYLMIVSTLLYFGTWVGCSVDILINYAIILLYILGPLSTIMANIPTLRRASISYNHIITVNKSVRSNPVVHKPLEVTKTPNFEKLEIKDLTLRYPNENFQLGPTNFTITKGEVSFIFGENGSGKTTLIKSILTLLSEAKMSVELNRKKINAKEYNKIRNLFSVVFSDFYLFDEFYGNKSFDKKRGKEYLKIFEVDKKININDVGFSSIDLSTGQRKRLALIQALLHDRPIVLLDEWAADQDPFFRKKFYTQIIPFIQQEGKTVVAITHDDRYYHCADRLWKMEDGKLTEINQF